MEQGETKRSFYNHKCRLKQRGLVYPMSARIPGLIARELELKNELKNLKKDIVELILQTDVYERVYNSEIEMDGVEVSTKTAKAHSVRVAYEHFRPKENDDE